MIRAIVTFDAAEGKIDTLRQALADGQPNVLAAGAKAISLCTVEGEPNRLVEVEEWESSDDHKAMMGELERNGTLAAMSELTTNVEVMYLTDVASSKA